MGLWRPSSKKMPSKKPNVAVVYFPGNNCEEESLKAALAAGMDGKIVRWNQRKGIEQYDGFIIPGGWGYEDRIRAGVIASKDPIFKAIKEQSENGVPVLGICNGAQALVECSMIPGLKHKVEMALAPNKNPFVSGYYCTQLFIRKEPTNSIFAKSLKDNEVLPVPIAHGEGRFTTKDPDLIKKLEKNKQIVFKYCTREGKVEDRFPVNPNGAVLSAAAIANKEGNVLAIMPHPERASFIRQLQDVSELKNSSNGNLRLMESFAPGMQLFLSMKKYIEEKIL